MQYRNRFIVPALLALLATSGCATTGGGGSENRDVLTREQIQVSSHTTAMDLVRAERPHWLRFRGAISIVTPQQIIVYVDGMKRGNVDALEDIPTANIQLMRHYDASEAQFKFGTGHAMGAIEIITRSSG